MRRRVLDELGLDISDPLSFEIYKLGKFKYIKHFDEFTEYEIDHVFLMSLNNSVELHPNAEEIEELKWIDLHVLEDWILTKPDDFTAWFFAVYNMYVWKEVWNPMMMCPPISKELDSVLGQRLEDISCVGLYV